LTKASELLQAAGYTPTYATLFSQFGIYVIGAVVVAVVAVAAVYMLRVRKKPVTSPASMPTAPTSTEPPPPTNP